MFPERQAGDTRYLPEERQDSGIAMSVVVRVEMGRGSAHQRVEPIELSVELLSAARAIVAVGAGAVEIDVQPKTQRRALVRHGSCAGAGRCMHEQAGAGQDPRSVRVGDTSVDTVADSEVVAVDDEMLQLGCAPDARDERIDTSVWRLWEAPLTRPAAGEIFCSSLTLLGGGRFGS
jgi:hypothetical protein